MSWHIVRYWLPDGVELDDSAIDAIESAASNEAYEQVQVWEADNAKS